MRSRIWLVTPVFFFATQPSVAHHSFAPFYLARNITLKGTIKEVQFTNPHVWLQVLIPNDRVARRNGVSRLERQGCCCAPAGSATA